MDNRERLISMIKGNENTLSIYVKQPDGTYKYFDEMLQKVTGRSFTESELRESRHPKFLLGDEETAKSVLELKGY
ncbi:MAG: hypothetical protein IKD78_04825 [Bacteroidales bacterium]|nr:hypothetical protein [Bacteroidales bacterium]MBR6929765.1 hypothetical protein [Bacteroidales bacterium]